MVIVAVIVAACVTIFANLLADKKFWRLDLTKEGRYSLSEPFRNILSRLEDKCQITYYVSDNGPPLFEHFKRDMLDKLHEIETASNGKIKLTAVDPTENKELRERLFKDGFQQEIQVPKKDQVVQALIFSGLEITYQDKPTVKVPFIYQAQELEYNIGSKILELTLKKKPIIAVMVPPAPPAPPMQMGRQPPGSGFEWIQQGRWDQDKKFEVRSVDLTENSPIPPDAALFIMVRPKNLNERQKYEFEKYLAGGGKVLLLASEFKVAYEFGWRVEKTPTSLEDYLKEVGVTLGQDFVADNMNLRIPFLNPFGEVEYQRAPVFIRIMPENIDQESVLTKLMPNLLVPSPSEIALDTAKLTKNKLTSQILAKSSKQSWIIPFSEGINLTKEQEYDEEKQVYTGERNVFVMLNGQFPFPYEGKPAPPWDAPHGPPPAPDKDKKEEPKFEKKEGSLTIFSGPEAFHFLYMSSQDIGQYMRGNYLVIPNVAENFGLGDDLIRLRTKTYETRTIKSLGGSANDFKRWLLKFALYGGPALLIFIFAAVWFTIRRVAQIKYERKYAATGPSSYTP